MHSTSRKTAIETGSRTTCKQVKNFASSVAQKTQMITTFCCYLQMAFISGPKDCYFEHFLAIRTFLISLLREQKLKSHCIVFWELLALLPGIFPAPHVHHPKIEARYISQTQPSDYSIVLDL